MPEAPHGLYSPRLSAITGLDVQAYSHLLSPTLVGYLDGRAVVAAQRHDWTETEKWFLIFNLGRVRDLKMEEQKGRCAQCGNIRPLQLHHIVFRSESRDDRPSNCEMLCDPCHKGGAHGLSIAPSRPTATHAAARTDGVSRG